MKFKLRSLVAWVVGGWVLDCMRLMLISTQVEVVVEVGVELGNSICLIFLEPRNRLLNCFFLLKTQIHMKILNTEPYLCNIKGLRYFYHPEGWLLNIWSLES